MAFLRLLQRKLNGEIVFREPTSGEVPAYAILSHTWGEEEVTYQELKKGKDKSKTVNKAGWRKIQFCAEQAKEDGLEYFWVDTCCIDKKNAVELGTAINSMFRWYQNAARCYVYLSDVSKPNSSADDQRAWEEAFRRSRWFTRGWTLQQLLAPATVEFFSQDCKRLGSRISLQQEIHEISVVPISALGGQQTLSKFSVAERMSWAAKRTTTLEEDKIYCLLGIFGVFLPLLYGEGVPHATDRLEAEIQRRQERRGTESQPLIYGEGEAYATDRLEAEIQIRQERRGTESQPLIYGEGEAHATDRLEAEIQIRQERRGTESQQDLIGAFLCEHVSICPHDLLFN
jgi:hypothetical protein